MPKRLRRCNPPFKTTVTDPLTPADRSSSGGGDKPLATTTPQPTPVGGKSKADGVKQALRALGGGAVAAKDAFWGSLDVLGAAAEAASKAPEKANGLVEEAKGLVEDGKAAIEGR